MNFWIRIVSTPDFFRYAFENSFNVHRLGKIEESFGELGFGGAVSVKMNKIELKINIKKKIESSIENLWKCVEKKIAAKEEIYIFSIIVLGIIGRDALKS